MQQTPGKIFLADQRGVVQTARHSRASTFSFGAYHDEHRAPFGPLAGLNDETLAAAQSVVLPVAAASHVVLLPITGALRVAAPGLEPTTLDVEEALVLTLPAGSTLQLTNPYPEDSIGFLHLWLTAERPVEAAAQVRLAFAAADLHNQLTALVAANDAADLPFSLHLGRFDGRQEAVHPVQGPRRLFFAFVVAGAFEVAGRLLHAQDGLALWDTAEVELEALSNNALVLVIAL